MSDLLLVTGAGASRNLGVGNKQLPLMADWASTLCEALDGEELGLASACRLDPDFDGPLFEKAIGEVLEWERVRPFEERFESLALENFNGAPQGALRQARQRTGERLSHFRRALNRTLYSQFGQDVVDDARAELAYKNLLMQLEEPKVTIATTNYDRSVESALLGLGHRVINGFSGRPPRRQVFTPSALAEQRGEGTTLLHLHGAVGWYERDGTVILDHPDERFDPNRGSPVVLYPDPGKKPSENAIVSELWQELEASIKQASNILVIGHSLHDDPLVEQLARIGSQQKLAISYYSKADKEQIQERTPSALPFQLDFSPESSLPVKVLGHFGLK